jgi:hypothetical protein
VLQLERTVQVQVMSEWTTASLYVAGCAEALDTLRAEERTAVVALLKERATQEPRLHFKTCDPDKRRAADPTVLAAVNAQLGRAAIDDWCWEIIALHGPG